MLVRSYSKSTSSTSSRSAPCDIEQDLKQSLSFSADGKRADSAMQELKRNLPFVLDEKAFVRMEEEGPPQETIKMRGFDCHYR